MRKLIQIIDENLGAKDFPINSFSGDVYFHGKEGLDIGKSDYNKLLDKFNKALENSRNSLATYEDLLAIFINEIFEDNSTLRKGEGRSTYISSIVLNTGLISLRSEENTTVTDKSSDSILYLSWDEIGFIELIESASEKELHFFRFYVKNNTIQHDLSIDRFGTDSLVASKRILKMLNEIVEYKNNTIDNSINEHVELQSKIEKLFNDENYKDGVEALDNYSKKYNINDITLDDSSFYYFNKIFGLRSMGRLDEALDTIDSYINRYKEIGEIEPYTYELKGEILSKLNKYISAINCFAISEENYENSEYKKGVHSKKEDVYSSLKKVFLDIPYNDRKFIFIGKDIYATASHDIVVLKEKDMPREIEFPAGHPQINQVYICHPIKQDFYLPIKKYSEALFLERINEFSYLLQGLGATHLDISGSKSSKSEDTKSSKKAIESDLNKIEKLQDFKTNKTPLVHNNLVWYHTDLNWQKLSDQRLHSSIITHTEHILTSQSDNVSSIELAKINAELKLLLQKASVKYTSKLGVSNADFKKQEWIVKVEFGDDSKLNEPIGKREDVSALNSGSESDEYKLNLKKYKEELLFMLEDDGIIDASERKILNRKIKKYGVSKADAIAIESKLLTSNYSENEQKYIEELKDVLKDGEISVIERKILNRYALKFNVSPKMQDKIDTIFID
ncbi:hypothetical protein [Formosa sp. PL04]|uniref:tetratricopeptide repeat protein n=1 Tax=Formosa sp. PL04 TaxID=3081755 RepID=UPI00298257FE|nr:hypothetical protein [Formosa sp. PL04]MDW5290966.1 hypothetical protein [Formosa sp. PL04]